ncbi:MAG: FAD-dependent oxidoreductase [Bacteroidota bacterium]|nr:FAD-dependent oxidoreductase [Bacteroidota bacterium]
MKRREFIIKSSIAGGALLTTPAINSIPGIEKKKAKSVLIIGAGFAGLSAAYQLKKKGISTILLEARNRIGGRVFSHRPESSKDLVIELGAEWVGNSHERLIALCKELSLELQNNQFETHLTRHGNYSKAGTWNGSETMEKFWTDKTALWETFSASMKKDFDKMDWWRFLLNQGFTEDDLALRDLMDSTDFGESIRHTSAYSAFAEYAESSEKNEMDLKIKGGNAKLAEKLADQIGRINILTNHNVVSVKQHSRDGVTVQCENGKTFQADKLICTTPTLSLKKINWTPKLPNIQIEAMNALQYARIGKFPLVFSERFWKEENFDMITDTPAHYFYHGTKNQEGKKGILIAYATGDKVDVLASSNKTQRDALILEALKPAFGDVKKYLEESLMYYWGTDAFSRGAYAFYGINQWFGVKPVLKQSYIHTHFAGEHLADWQGFMEGAINTGEEAVDELIG